MGDALLLRYTNPTKRSILIVILHYNMDAFHRHNPRITIRPHSSIQVALKYDQVPDVTPRYNLLKIP